MKQIITLALLLFITGSATEAYSQSWLEDLGRKAVEKAKSKTEEKIEEKVGDGIDKVYNKSTDSENGDEISTASDANGQEEEQGGKQQKGQSLEMTYAKSDFVAGDQIIFEDNLDNEQIGEFPSQWDLYEGNCEIVSIGGKKAFELYKSNSEVRPLMKNSKNYLGDVFTIEFDFMYSSPPNDDYCSQWFHMDFYTPDSENQVMSFEKAVNLAQDSRIQWNWRSAGSSSNSGSAEVALNPGTWNHFAVSFNKRAFKVYVNGVRVMNIPNVVSPPGWFTLYVTNGDGHSCFTNFRTAQGAVPLYDRMMNDGKFITYGITFDIGKSTIKPESMGEINRIVKLMIDNPTLKFSVEGHTDATGNAASNQTLSEKRSNAIVNKLVELGIATDRLTAVGKGQTMPIADNSTDEGRAKNRRVEFVKQ